MMADQARSLVAERVAVNAAKATDSTSAVFETAQKKVAQRVKAYREKQYVSSGASAVSASASDREAANRLIANRVMAYSKTADAAARRQQKQEAEATFAQNKKQNEGGVNDTTLHENARSELPANGQTAPVVYGPERVVLKYDWGDETTSNLSFERQGSSQTNMFLCTSPQDTAREWELTDLYTYARDTEGKMFLRVEECIDFSKVPDYESLYVEYMQSQTEDGEPLTANQKKCYTAAFAVAIYDVLEEDAEEKGGYDPYSYLAFAHFMTRMFNGDVESIDFDTLAFTAGEIENYKLGKKIGKDISEKSLAVKMLYGYSFRAGEAIESLANLSNTLSGNANPVSPFSTAYSTVDETLEGPEKVAYNVSGSFGYMTPYMLVGPAGYSVMFSQSFSSSMNSALREGQSYSDSLGYGITSATMEVTLNKLLGATGGVLGKSVLGQTTSALLQKGFQKITVNPLIKKLVIIGGERIASGIGEYTEEALQVYADVLLRNFFFDENNQLSMSNEEAVYNGWIGFVVGMLLGDGSNKVASSQLLNGTAAENLEVVKTLCGAAQELSTNPAQSEMIQDTLLYAEQLYNGDAGETASQCQQIVESNMQDILKIWTQVNAKATENTHNQADFIQADAALMPQARSSSDAPVELTTDQQLERDAAAATRLLDRARAVENAPSQIAPVLDRIMAALDKRYFAKLYASPSTTPQTAIPAVNTTSASTKTAASHLDTTAKPTYTKDASVSTTPSQPAALVVGDDVHIAPTQHNVIPRQASTTISDIVEKSTEGFVEGAENEGNVFTKKKHASSFDVGIEESSYNHDSLVSFGVGNQKVKENSQERTRYENSTESEYDIYNVSKEQVVTTKQKGTVDLFKYNVTTTRASLKSKYKKSGNIALAQVDISGVPSELKAFSRVNKETDVGAELGFVFITDNPIFSTFEIDGFDRSCDTEAKILERIAGILGSNNLIQGKITLFTERTPCESCMSVFKQFKNRYSNIQITVYDGLYNVWYF